jgi:chromosome partitioning protein
MIYAIANQKGGVGKTTTAINLAATLAQAGERVLLVDMDSQANATTGLGNRLPPGEPSILDVLLSERPLAEILRTTVVENLVLAPSSPEMAGAELLLAALAGRERRLKDVLHGPQGAAYSYVFVDCPPSLGLLTVNALVAADQVIVPVQAEYYALEGMAQLLQTVEAVRDRLNPGLRVAGLLLTMVDLRTNLARDVEREVREHFPGLTFQTVVPRNVRLAEAPSHGLPVSLLDPQCPGSDAYFDLAQEVLDRA